MGPIKIKLCVEDTFKADLYISPTRKESMFIPRDLNTNRVNVRPKT